MKLCDFEAGLDQALFLITGPCVIESEQLALDSAGRLQEICSRLEIPLIYKSSFDQANRSSSKSFRGPGIEQDKRIDAQVYFQDVMPTTLEWAGIEKPESVAFRSLVPLLSGEAAAHYDAIYGAYIDHQRMVTDGEFKLVYYPKIDKTQLFDLRNDPNETKDLSESPEHTARIGALWTRLKSLQNEMGDELALR